jgi:hypothetical protein
MQHVTVYREEGRYAGWPANYGIWSWGDEIVVGFTAGYPTEKDGFHARDKDRPFTTMQARSLDGGQTWQSVACPCRTPGNRGTSADEHMRPDLGAKYALEHGMDNTPVDCPGGINFTHPDFALMCARTGLGAGTVAWFYVSYDRCRTWEGPYSLPMFGQAGVEARTDYLVSGPNECTLFLTATKASGGEGGGIFCARTIDGGKTFEFASWVTQQEQGFTIMPTSVRVSDSRILVAVRCHGGPGGSTAAQYWIDLYASDDNGATWAYLNRAVPDTGRGGNPPALIRLQDGRLCLVYGYRAEPYGMRAKLSGDGGATWGDEIVLRDDGGSHDLGYPRAVQRADGTIVTVYYFNDHLGGEGYIAATLWEP